MIVIDLGNTNIVIGFYSNKKIIKSIRFKTSGFKFNEKIKLMINNNLKKLKLISNLNIIVLGSVVPDKNIEIKKISKNIRYKIVNIENEYIFKKINNIFHLVKDLGSDRIANTIAGIKSYGNNIIIVDFGTATTFDIIKKGKYIGGVISPGIQVSNIALSISAAKLRTISIKKNYDIAGKNTEKAMQSGFFWGYVSLINGIISIIIKQKKFKPKIILTGGLAKIFSKEIKLKAIIDQNLTLNGLYHIGKINVKSK